MKKTCTQCGTVKEAKFFHKNRTKKNGLQSQCKICSNGNKTFVYRSEKTTRVEGTVKELITACEKFDAEALRRFKQIKSDASYLTKAFNDQNERLKGQASNQNALREHFIDLQKEFEESLRDNKKLADKIHMLYTLRAITTAITLAVFAYHLF